MEDKKKKQSTHIVTEEIELIFHMSLNYLTRLLDIKSIYKTKYILLHQQQTEEGYHWKYQQKIKKHRYEYSNA